MSRFVILEHDYPSRNMDSAQLSPVHPDHSDNSDQPDNSDNSTTERTKARHWDFMLEEGDRLRTWRLSEAPKMGSLVSAVLSFDHRVHYLDYEGPVSGNRGWVLRVEAGIFTWVKNDLDEVIVELTGSKFSGTAVLRREDDTRWSFFLAAHN